jgi:hypothetical protein
MMWNGQLKGVRKDKGTEAKQQQRVETVKTAAQPTFELPQHNKEIRYKEINGTSLCCL